MPKMLTAFQKLLMFKFLFHSIEVRSRVVAMAMTQEGIPMTNKQVNSQLSRTPFSSKSTMSPAEFEEHRREVYRDFDSALGSRSERVHREILQRVLSDCSAIRRRHSWTETSEGSARGIQTSRLQSAGKMVRLVGKQVTTVAEYFAASKALLDPVKSDQKDRLREFAAGLMKSRADMATRMVELEEAGTFSGLKSADLESIGGSFTGRTPADYRMDCRNKLATLMSNVPVGSKGILEAALFQNQVMWSEGDLRAIEHIKLALDIACCYDRQISWADLEWRWPNLMTETAIGRFYVKTDVQGHIDRFREGLHGEIGISRDERERKNQPA